MGSVALQFWLRIQALFWLPVLVMVAFCPGTVSWEFSIAGIAVSFASVVAVLRALRTPADVVTVARILGLVAVAWVVAVDVPILAWLSVLGLVLLDLVDGWLARRFGGSAAGAVLDMEADQLTVLLLALLLVRGGGGEHVLLVPGIRYFFVLAMWLLRLPAHDPKPVDGDNRRGRLCCALVVGALMLALWPGLGLGLADMSTAFAVLVLAYSFGSDARFLIGRLRSARSTA